MYLYEPMDRVDVEVSTDGQLWEFYTTCTYEEWEKNTIEVYTHARIASPTPTTETTGEVYSTLAMREIPEFVEVNLPFSWGDIEYTDEEYADTNFVEKTCFRDEVGLKPGMLLDCLCSGERQYLFVGDMNVSTGGCGCCNKSITFVYRYLQYPLPSSLLEGEQNDESRTE